MKIVYWRAVTTLGVLALAGAVGAAPGGRDANRAHRGSAPQVAPDVVEEDDDPSAQALAKTIATVALAAPSTEVAIDVTVTNKSSAGPIGARDIQAVIIDCFRGLAKQSLTVDDVFNVVPPAGGTATVSAGSGATMGPAVLTFTGFSDGETSTFSLDPDTWDNPGFGATRADLSGCRVEVVFFGAESLRGDGNLKLKTGSDTVVASIKQRFPKP
jgi:hypothetical protein